MSDLDEEEYIATRRLNGLDKTADEMFEEIGYKKIVEHEFTELEYGEETELILYKDEIKGTEIEFWNDKTISKTIQYDVSYITMPELQAINKKCQELGWI